MQNRDEHFARNIRAFYKERLRVEFVEASYGFVGFSQDGTDLTIDEWYVRPGSTFWDAIRLVRRAIAIGKARGCNRLLGGNESTLPSYRDIKVLHTWFGMTYLESNGTMEIWSKPI